jgi:tetrahydromethanopterin S-methyltransferase subunit G
MELMAERWTEERLDDLKGQVERLEERTDAGFRDLRQEMDRRFDKVDERFDKFDRRFEVMDGRLYAIHRTLLLFLGSMFAAMIGLIATVIATQL